MQWVSSHLGFISTRSILLEQNNCWWSYIRFSKTMSTIILAKYSPTKIFWPCSVKKQSTLGSLYHACFITQPSHSLFNNTSQSGFSYLFERLHGSTDCLVLLLIEMIKKVWNWMENVMLTSTLSCEWNICHGWASYQHGRFVKLCLCHAIFIIASNNILFTWWGSIL